MKLNRLLAAAFFIAAVLACPSCEASGGSAGDLEQRIERVMAVKDGTVASLKVTLHTKAEPEGKDPLEMWRAEEKEKVELKDAFVRVDFSLSPEEGSDIKCRAELPLPEKWDGRLWGQGNSGRAGSIRALQGYLAAGTAAVTTDLGTSSVAGKGVESPDVVWSPAILRDFHWRATHLMTVYGKRIVEAFYGRPANKAYFAGGSTGGRQAMSEAIRYPEDYDGFLVSLPDNNAAVNEIAAWHLWRQTHDATGKSLFTAGEMQEVADAAVRYRAKTDPAPYAGRILADARFDAAEIDGFLALAAEKCPSLAKDDKIAQLKSLYMPLMHDGKCYFSGYAPGSYLGKNMEWHGLVSLKFYLMEKGIGAERWAEVGWKEIDMYLRERAPEFNACSPDLDAFRKRGGKIMMSLGWEDQTVPPGPIVEYYERVCERSGGLEATKRWFRLFCIPGCAHGGGKGRAMTGTPSGVRARRLLVLWCENGQPPEMLDSAWKSKKLDMPIAAYPGLYVKDSAGKWNVRQVKRSVPLIDEMCLETKKMTYDVKSFGAVGNGSVKDTAALQRALDACAKTGGRVVVPPGNYLTGSLFLGDNTELHLQEGATLIGSPDLGDYNADDAYPQNFSSPREGWSAKHLILAIERRNVSITGRGAIDGNGRAFLEEKPSRYGAICWRDGCCEVRGGRKNMGRPGQEIVFVECEGVTVRDVTFRDMSCWSCLFYGCADVTVGGVTVRNNIRGFNTDGFDVDSCRNVRIGDCDITTGDDAIAIRGAPGHLKDKTKVCENVRVSNIVCRVSSSGVRVGVGNGAIRDVKVSDMKIERAGRGIHVQCCYVKSKGKVEVRGVDISDVTFERISIRNAASAVLVVAGYPSSRAKLENIRFSGIDAEFFAPCFVAGNGITRARGVEFSDCAFRVVRAPGKVPSDSEAGMLACDRNGAFRIQQADDVAFRRCSLAWDADADPELTRAFAVHDAPQPLVDAGSSMNDRK
ncbi:MAG: tannase/feruloyl esterase family alpha/beta hydrolase [Kiritimatiellae bacterium]|nr:tannase/feruloyl esterase family alpha/beta hydrolase [Kiritimatiellia bacterium]